MSVTTATDQDFNEILENHAKVVVKYSAEWCGQCRLFAPKFKRLSNDERFEDVFFVDVDTEKNPDARKVAGVTDLPHFAVFKDGELVKGDATSKEDAVVEMIESLN